MAGLRRIVFEDANWVLSENGHASPSGWRNFRLFHRVARRGGWIKRTFYISYNMAGRRFAKTKDLAILSVFEADMPEWVRAMAHGKAVSPPPSGASPKSFLPDGLEAEVLRIIAREWDRGVPLGLSARLKEKGRHAPTQIARELAVGYHEASMEVLRLYAIGAIRREVKSSHSRVTGLRVVVSEADAIQA